MSSKIRDIYHNSPASLEKRINEFIFHAKRFHVHRDGRSQNYLLENVKPLSLYFDSVVDAYLEESFKKTENLKGVELFILIFTLFTLVLEALFIFLPADISIAKKTKEIIAQKDYSNAVIESSTNAIVTLDSNLKIRTFNKAAQEIFGYSQEEVPDIHTLIKIIPKEFDNLLINGLDKFLALHVKNKNGEVFETTALNKNGEKFPVRISMGTSGDLQNLAIVANIQDISKEKFKDKILQQQAKFAALGEMIAIIAHQWRQPLAELNFNYMYIKKKIKDDVLVAEFAKNEEIIHFMSDTITNFEDFYKDTEVGEFKPSDSILQAKRLLKSILSLNQVEIVEDIEFDGVIIGNQNALAQVVLSILQNMIDVFRQREIKRRVVHVELKSENDFVKIELGDNAGGIVLKPIEDIFKPFTSKKKVASTGIGLYMSRLVVVDKFHGEITAQNIKDGALFSIKIPKAYSIK